MARYTVQMTHVPGHGNRDHLFATFACAVANRLDPQGYASQKRARIANRRRSGGGVRASGLPPEGYPRKRGGRFAMRRVSRGAGDASQFDGKYQWTIIEV